MWTWSEISNLSYFVWLRIYSQIGDLEKFAFGLIAAMTAVWVVGSVANARIANNYYSQIRPHLEAHFAAPGSTELVKESNAHFFVYSTGRKNCSGMATSFMLSARQDFLNRFVFSWFTQWYKSDRIEIEIFASSEIDSACTFLLCKKFKLKQFESAFGEISKFTKPANGAINEGPFGKAFSQSSLTGFACSADAGGKAVVEQTLGRRGVTGNDTNGFAQIINSIEYIYVSRESKSIKCVFNCSRSGDLPMNLVVDFCLGYLLDSIAGVRVSESVRAEVETARNEEVIKQQQAEEKAQRDEAAAKRRAEAEKTMSPAQREKMQEKELKRAQKKQMSKGRMFF